MGERETLRRYTLVTDFHNVWDIVLHIQRYTHALELNIWDVVYTFEKWKKWGSYIISGM